MTEEPAPERTERRSAGIALLAAAVVVAAGVTAYLFLSDGGSEGTPPAVSLATPAAGARANAARPEVGKPAPDFALVDARDGVTVHRLSDYRGQAVVLNWYASWCGPCKDEIPDFQEAQKTLGDQVVFLGVNYRESRERATGILDIFRASYPAVLDVDGSLSDRYRVENLPTTFFIDGEGILRAERIGTVTTDLLEKHLAAVGVTYSAP
jgi:thiol-disulfide isomerase/thioredoxin